MNIKFETGKIRSLSEFLDEIDRRVVKSGFYFMLIINETKQKDIKYLVDEIKSHFDIFVFLETDIPRSKTDVDKSFFDGFHGIYYRNKNIISDVEKDILLYSSTLFPKGSLFLEYRGRELEDINKILDMNFLPVLKSGDLELLNYTKERINEIKKLSKYLRYVPMIEQEKYDYQMRDKLKKKVLLETDNLRKKLMIKNVEASFNSSGL